MDLKEIIKNNKNYVQNIIKLITKENAPIEIREFDVTELKFNKPTQPQKVEKKDFSETCICALLAMICCQLFFHMGLFSF